MIDLSYRLPHCFSGSSLSNHSVTYSSRSSSCQPTRMYQSESIRTAAKLNRPASKLYMCQEERDRARSPGLQRAKSPSRFDGTPVELPGFMKSNYYLHHDDLSMGQKTVHLGRGTDLLRHTAHESENRDSIRIC